MTTVVRDGTRIQTRLTFKTSLPSWFPTLCAVIFGLFGVGFAIGGPAGAIFGSDLGLLGRLILAAASLGFGALSFWYGRAFLRAGRALSGYLELRDKSIIVYDSVHFAIPWEVPLERIRGVLIDRTPTKGLATRFGGKRFRISPMTGTAAVEPLAGWLYSQPGGSPLPQIRDESPNLAILLEHPSAFNSLRPKVSLTNRMTGFAGYGPSIDRRPKPNSVYGGVLLAVNDLETAATYFRERHLLMEELSSDEAARLGATKERERTGRAATYWFLAIMIILLIIRIRLMYFS